MEYWRTVRKIGKTPVFYVHILGENGYLKSRMNKVAESWPWDTTEMISLKPCF